MACENPEDCNDPTYTTPVPVAPFPVAGGGSGSGTGGEGGSCDCDPTSGSYPTSTTLSTDINGTTQVSVASCSGLSTSDVVLKETLIYDSDGTVGRVIALNSGKLTVQTMTTAGDGAGSKSDGSYLTTSTLTTAFTGTTNVPQNTVTGLSPADVVLNETLIFDGEGTVGRVIGISGSNYIVQTMTISPGERSGTRLGSVEKEANLPANCAAAISLGWQTPISGDFAYVRDHNGHLAEFVATVDDSCNITWQWSHDLNAGDYLTGVKDQDGNPLPIDGDGMVTLPRESDGTYHSNTALNKSIGGTRNIALSATDIAAVGDIVLNETLVFDDDGTVGKVTAVSGTTLTIKTITIAGDGDASDGSYPTTDTLDLTIGNSTTIAYGNISGIVPLADIVLNETLIYDAAGTLGRVISVNASSNTVTVETMTTAGSQDTVSDGTYSTTKTLDKTIGNTQTLNLSDTAIAAAGDIMPGETLLFDAKGTVARVDSINGTGVITATTITTAGVSDGVYNTSDLLANKVGDVKTISATVITGISLPDVVLGETLVNDNYGRVGKVVAVNTASNTVDVETITIGVGATTNGLVGGWFYATDEDGSSGKKTATGSRFWMLENNACDDHRGTLRSMYVPILDPLDGSSQNTAMVELPGPAVYYANGVLSVADSGTDTFGIIFEYDPVTNTSKQVSARTISTAHANDPKRNSSACDAIIEVPAGQVKYVGFVNTERGAAFYLDECSFSVHQISGTKFLGNTTVSNKIETALTYEGNSVIVTGNGSTNVVGLQTYHIGAVTAGDSSMISGDSFVVPVSGFYSLEAYVESSQVYNRPGCVAFYKEEGGNQIFLMSAYSEEVVGYNSVASNGARATARTTALVYLVAGTKLRVGGWFQDGGYVDGNNRVAIALISGDSPAELMMKPNLWTPNTEIDFGDGVYGYRSAKNVACDVVASTSSYLGNGIDTVCVVNSATVKVMGYGGGFWEDASTHRYTPLGSDSSHYNVAAFNTYYPQNDSADLRSRVDGGDTHIEALHYLQNHSGAASWEQDIWVLYTK